MSYQKMITSVTAVMDELHDICHAMAEDQDYDADLEFKAFDEAQELLLTLQAIKEEKGL